MLAFRWVSSIAIGLKYIDSIHLCVYTTEVTTVKYSKPKKRAAWHFQVSKTKVNILILRFCVAGLSVALTVPKRN